MSSNADRAEIVSRVRGVLQRVLNDSIRTWSIDRPLSDAPVNYDSVTRVETVAAIEAEFGVSVEAVTPEDLASISTMADLVARAKPSEV
jgi:acyl carrier protein